MFITKKKHNQIIEHKDKSINDAQAKVIKLESELKIANDLKSILEKMSCLTINGSNVWSVCNGSYDIQFNDSIAQYVDDYCGGKVLKQEAIKVIEITLDGEIKTGLTKQKADEGFSYKLIRQQ